MRVNFSAPVSFGYSKKSQEYIDKKTKTLEDRKLADSIRKCSEICNSLEDEIKAQERSLGVDKYNTSSLIDFFVDLKETIYTSIMSMFSDSEKYFKSEYNYYSGPLKRMKNQDNWRQDIIETINKWEIDDTKEQKPGSDFSNMLLTVKDDNTENSTSLVKELVLDENSPRGFHDVLGMNKIKKELKEDIIDPVNNPWQAEIDFLEYGKKVPRGILLYGPPGCGKTHIVQALSSEIDIPVYKITAGSIGSKYINQSSKNIEKSFDYVQKQAKKLGRPVILFMDEMEAVALNRTLHTNDEDIKQTSTLLQAIEEAQKNDVIVVGATNKYDLVDPAVRRRLKEKKFAKLPDETEIEELIRSNLASKSKAYKFLLDNEAVKKVSRMLIGYSYLSVERIAEDALVNAKNRNRSELSLIDFKKAIDETEEEIISEEEYKPKTIHRKVGFQN